MTQHRYEARAEGRGQWRMYKDGQPTVDGWAGPLAEESAKIYEAFWNTEYGAIVRQHGYYTAVAKGLIPPGGNVPRDVQQRLQEVLSPSEDVPPIQRSLWEE
jgi:hypothetical protein